MRKPRKREQSPRLQPEQYECQTFIRRLRQYYYEIFCRIYHIKNESKTAHIPDIGILSGVPDYCYPVARGGYHACYIEMKKPEAIKLADGGISEDQSKIIAQLEADGNFCIVCYNWEQALEAVLIYDQGIASEIPTKSL